MKFVTFGSFLLLQSILLVQGLDLCYRLRWRLADPTPPARFIRPVTGQSKDVSNGVEKQAQDADFTRVSGQPRSCFEKDLWAAISAR